MPLPLLVFVVACGPADCGAVPTAALPSCVAERCAPQQDLARDGCVLDALARRTDLDGVLALAPTIRDPLVRDAAVLRWSADHHADVPPGQAAALCATLTPKAGDKCRRSFERAHLAP